MDTLISPARFTLTEPQLAAALTLARITPSARTALPVLAAPADATAVLRGTPCLDGSGTLDPGLHEALAVLADTRRVVSIAANVAGTSTWLTSQITLGAADEPYVAYARDERHDLAILPTLMDAVLYADELLSVTAGLSQEGEPAVSLSLNGVAALTTLADALQQAKLEAVLDRRVEYAATWTVADLDALLAAGIAHDDTRWTTTAIRHTAPAPLEDANGHLPEGLSELSRAGLATRSGDQWSLTPAGHSRALALGQLVNVGAITAVSIGADGAPVSAAASVFRTVLGVWVLTWNAGDATVTADLEEVTAGRALGLVRALLAP